MTLIMVLFAMLFMRCYKIIMGQSDLRDRFSAFGVTLVLAIVFSVYMLSGREKLLSQCRRVMRAYLPGSWADRVQSVVQLSADTFTNFVSGQLTEACILGVLCAWGCCSSSPTTPPWWG